MYGESTCKSVNRHAALEKKIGMIHGGTPFCHEGGGAAGDLPLVMSDGPMACGRSLSRTTGTRSRRSRGFCDISALQQCAGCHMEP